MYSLSLDGNNRGVVKCVFYHILSECEKGVELV